MDAKSGAISRRAFLGRLGVGGAAVGAVLAGCELAGAPAGPGAAQEPGGTGAATGAPAASAAPAAAGTAAAPGVVRLSSVVIPQESGLYAQLLPEFERRSGLRVEVTTASDTEVYGPARTGKFDIVLSHYQHEGVSPFMQDGFGEWPRMILSSPIAVVGPPGDPAGVKGLTDLVEAFRRIAKSGTFVVNDQDGLRYVAEVARRAADLPAGGPWYVDKATRGPEAIRAAAQSGGYTMWGVVPFLRLQQQSRLPLTTLVTQDQLLRSVMVTVVVNDRKVANVNAKGARALQQYLIDAETQAKIRTFRMAGVSEQIWWPAAQDNEKAAFARP